MSLGAQSSCKLFLQSINKWLSHQNIKSSVNIWHSVFKWNYDHHLIKNILKLFNKTLKGLNKYHVFKIQYIYPFIGMGIGYIVIQLEETIDQIQNLQFKPQISGLVTDKVLKNDQIRLLLQKAVNDNVLANEDIQTNLHFILMHKVLIPQTDRINNLVKMGLLNLIKSDDLFRLSEQQAVQAIRNNKQLISKAAFTFLLSQTMQNIIKNHVAPLIKGQSVQKIVSTQAISLITTELYKQQNKEKVYEFLRQKII